MIASPGLQLVALSLCGGDVLVRALRIRLLVPTGGLSLWQAVTVNAYGDAASAVTPGRVGGDPARYWGFRRAAVPVPSAVAGLAVEALIDWVLLALATLALSIGFAATAANGVRRLAALAAAPRARILIAFVVVLAVLCVILIRYLRRAPHSAVPMLVLAWRQACALGWRRVALAAALTTVSMVSRTAILPVLVAGLPGLDLGSGAVWLGSFALLFGQLALPTPAGVGAIELGFAGGFAGKLAGHELAELLIVWRVYTLLLSAALGAMLLGRAWLAAWSARRRYSVNSSVNVRSQV
ncbi:MAG TPA: lysylphosphatidylglycerol synthase domain-containing protein [Gemmatimonadales bacterium]|nr:lysylphosphatidylglycerol synthase domain-containing protein [Gemmatimonadales bacterium]